MRCTGKLTDAGTGLRRYVARAHVFPDDSHGSPLQSSGRTSSFQQTSSLDGNVRGPGYSIDHVQENATIAE